MDTANSVVRLILVHLVGDLCSKLHTRNGQRPISSGQEYIHQKNKKTAGHCLEDADFAATL